MTKRFTLTDLDCIYWKLCDEDTEIMQVHRKDAIMLCELLNTIHKENQELKQSNMKKKDETHKKVMEDVIALIDKQILYYKEKHNKVNTGDCICVKYSPKIQCLEDVKRELLKMT